ncbi:MAG: AMP-binding protein, partial [Myxococcota bacterium]
RARKVLDGMEPERYGPLAGAVSKAKKQVSDTQNKLDKVAEAFELFMPFTYDNKYVFRTNQMRALFARMSEADRALLPFDTENIDWRHYWLDVHMPGLEKWVFPRLDQDGPKRVPIPRDYRDLAELFTSRTAEHGRRVAYRIVRKGDEVADSFTYRDVHRAARAAAEFLRDQDIGRGDRVLLASEGRPEWGMSYFGVILAGATVVPLDVDLSREEIINIARASGAKLSLASDELAQKLLARDDDGMPIEGASEFPLPVETFDRVFARAHEVQPEGALIKRKPEDAASIVFTSGTTGRPKGVVLLDRNFASLTARMAALFDLNRTDGMLSVLPPHHTFEFSAGLLLPLAHGASITYLEERTPELISKAFREAPITALVGVPAVWESLHRKIVNEIGAIGPGVLPFVKLLMRLNRMLRDRTAWNPARWLLRPIQDAVGGRMRYMVSGAAPLKQEIYKDLRGMGFSIYEGYGLTEAAPVLTVGWPNHFTPPGSVGWPLPGLDVRIAEPNDDGVGEIIARGPTIMTGYLDDEGSTARSIRDGWLHTGDRGRFDDEGRLFIVGRDKDVIIDTSGKNVYPDEIEEIYGDYPLIQELSVVGVPAESGTGERVASLVVPNYEAKEAVDESLAREDVRERIRKHFKDVGSRLPFARRVKIMHLWDGELPRTSTQKVRRSLVKDEIIRLENTLSAARGGGTGVKTRDGTELSVRRTVAAIAQKDVKDVLPHHSLADQLGFDSLMQLELYTAIEAEFPRARISQDEMNVAEAVAD